jgi:hypothetical protein
MSTAVYAYGLLLKPSYVYNDILRSECILHGIGCRRPNITWRLVANANSCSWAHIDVYKSVDVFIDMFLNSVKYWPQPSREMYKHSTSTFYCLVGGLKGVNYPWEVVLVDRKREE